MLGVAFLITGNLIGAGILGLPIITGLAGFIPALAGMLVVGGAMFYTAIVLGKEATAVRSNTFNYPSLYRKYLGSAGKWVAILANMIILYGLLTAYLTGATTIIVNLFHFPFPKIWVMLGFFAIITTLTVTNMSVLKKYNAVLMFLLWGSFAVIVCISERYVKLERLTYEHWSYLPLAIPIIVTAFHFHNIIPTICQGLKWDSRVIWKTMLFGMIIGLVMNAVWVQVGIGALPLKEGGQSIVNAFVHNLPATVPMSTEIHSTVFGVGALLFALLAIATSYLANATGLLAFIKDLTVNYFKISSRPLVIALTFLPPLIISIVYPNIFLDALNIVGGVGIVILFGILPSMLAIIRAKTVPKRVLGAAMLILFTVFLLFQLGQQFGLIKFKSGKTYTAGFSRDSLKRG